MSICGPRYLMDMALHSMCQPGRPGPHGLSQLGGAPQDVVVDIGHVLDVVHLVALVGQVAGKSIEGDVGKGMARMRGVVRRHPTDVHAHRIVADGEILDRACRCVVQPHWSAISFWSRALWSRGLPSVGPVPCHCRILRYIQAS